METVAVFIENEKLSCYDVLAAPNMRIKVMPLEAAASVGESAIDLAIIDCGTDVDYGLLILKKMKRSRADVPVIFITEASSEAVVMEAFRLGARGYFRKPLDPFELNETTARILGFKRKRSEKWTEPYGRGEYEIPALFRLPDKLPERLQRAIGYIEENLSTPLCLDVIAQQACLSKYHFCRLFKRNVGVSPKQYCVYRRLELAQQILSRPSDNITVTALKSGFNDVTGFIRQFKKITGVTPGVYRDSLFKSHPPK